MSTYAGQPKRRGIVLTVIGALLMFVLAPAVFVVGVVIGVNGALDIVRQAPKVAPGGTVQMAAGQTRDVYAYFAASFGSDGVNTSGTISPTPTCKVQDPSGGDVPLTAPTGSTTWTRDGGQYVMAGSFTAKTAGDYRVDCGQLNMLLPDGHDASRAGEKAITGVGGGVAVASIAGLAGLIMLIIGIVKLVNSGRERSQYRLQQQVAQWNPGGPPN